MKVAAVVGLSGSGKTTLLRELVAELVAEGRTVAAIKHTHHPLDTRDRGDSSLLRGAGANPVILAGDKEAIRFDGHQTSRFSYALPSELLDPQYRRSPDRGLLAKLLVASHRARCGTPGQRDGSAPDSG